MLDEDTTRNQAAEGATMVTPPPAQRSGGATRKATLIVLEGWEIGREIHLSEAEHLFGRSPTADTQINSPSVSRQHAKIVHSQEAGSDFYLVIDLNSSNGTRVGDEPVTSARLNDGDKVQMGEVLFKFTLQDEADERFHHDVHRLIHYNQLTGLMTMESFRREFEGAISRAAAATRMTLAMTDLDGLKRVNDTYGHLAGRMVVREMGAMMRQSLREQDLPALYGGDEAVILFPDTRIEDAFEVAEQLRQTIAARVFEHDGHSFQVTITQGLAEWPQHGKTPEQLIAAADRALYAAKGAGRNCIQCATE